MVGGLFFGAGDDVGGLLFAEAQGFVKRGFVGSGGEGAKQIISGLLFEVVDDVGADAASLMRGSDDDIDNEAVIFSVIDGAAAADELVLVVGEDEVGAFGKGVLEFRGASWSPADGLEEGGQVFPGKVFGGVLVVDHGWPLVGGENKGLDRNGKVFQQNSAAIDTRA